MNAEPVLRRTVIVANRLGLHARAAQLIAEAARRYAARLLVTKGVEQVEAKDVLQLMCLAAEQGESLQLEASGPDAQQALDAVCEVFVELPKLEDQKDA